MATKYEPNFGPGSISTVAKSRIKGIQAATPKKVSLLNAIMNPGSTVAKMSPSAAAIKDRDDQQKALKKEVGGRK